MYGIRLQLIAEFYSRLIENFLSEDGILRVRSFGTIPE